MTLTDPGTRGRPASGGAPDGGARGGRAQGRPEHFPLSQQVYLTLRDTLMVGGFSPGESVSLRTLASRLGTSPMPVREAVGRLIAENALQMLPNRQIIVPLMSRRRFEELWRVREMLEGMAAQLACANLTEDDLTRLEQLNAVSLEALKKNEPEVVLAANKDFHFSLYALSGSMVLQPMIEGLWMQIGPFMRLSLAAKARWDGLQHVEILKALRNRDADAVAKAVGQDIGNMAQTVVETSTFADEDAGPLSRPHGRPAAP